MSTTSDFGLLEAKIKAIQAKNVTLPETPVDVANTEAEAHFTSAEGLYHPADYINRHLKAFLA